MDLEEKKQNSKSNLKKMNAPLCKHAPQRNYGKIFKKTKFQNLNCVGRFLKLSSNFM